MKAIHCTRYGSPDNLKMRETPMPRPGETEILVRVEATTVTRADTMMRQGTPRFARLFLGLRRPKPSVTGTGFAGTVFEMGVKVTEFHIGDRVFGETGVSFGAHAEFLVVDQEGIVTRLPDTLSADEAAPLTDGALTAMNFLSVVSQLRASNRILINGAAGGIGSAAVQIAAGLGAEVTGVCSTRNVEFVRSLGASKIIDYKVSDISAPAGGYDIIFDTIGTLGFRTARPWLSDDGLYLSPVLTLPLLMQMLITSLFGGKRAKFSATGLQKPARLRRLLGRVLDLVNTGELKTVIDRRYPLTQIAEAHRYVDQGHKRGNVVVTPG